MNSLIRAVLVSVDYADLLALTLPYNRHQFKDVLVVTHPRDGETIALAEKFKCQVYKTDAFYRNGALFNKWLALEEGLDRFKREGWLCLMDADVLWPTNAHLWLRHCKPGYLYTPRRRMCHQIPLVIPDESGWKNYRLHRNEMEFAGYTQLFHSNDPVLGPAPWHQVDWTHAGGADSFFQAKWQPNRKVRPGFEVLHLGDAGVNWAGRASTYRDGRRPEGGDERYAKLREILRVRRTKTGLAQFSHEKVKPNT